MAELFNIRKYWLKYRYIYNIALIIAGILGFISYCIVGSTFINYFEVTISAIFFQGIMYLIMMGFANITYTLFMNIDCWINKSNQNNLVHKIIYYGYFALSCLLPFSTSAILIITN